MDQITNQAAAEDQASMVYGADSVRSDEWLNELMALLWRYASQGIGQDVCQMDLAELQGLYRYLTRLQLSQAPDIDES